MVCCLRYPADGHRPTGDRFRRVLFNPAGCQLGHSSTSTVQKMLELIDHKILITDYAFDQIPNRDDPNQLTVI